MTRRGSTPALDEPPGPYSELAGSNGHDGVQHSGEIISIRPVTSLEAREALRESEARLHAPNHVRTRENTPSINSACQPSTANSFQAPGTPLSACSPRSANAIPDPTTRSFTVPDTRTSPGVARAPTLAAM